jgi:hypothetical protein
VIVDMKKKIMWVMHENDGLCVLISIFGSLHKKRENKKNCRKKTKKYIPVKKGHQGT